MFNLKRNAFSIFCFKDCKKHGLKRFMYDLFFYLVNDSVQMNAPENSFSSCQIKKYSQIKFRHDLSWLFIQANDESIFIDIYIYETLRNFMDFFI